MKIYDKAIFFQSNPLPIWIYDVKTLQIVDVNKTALDQYGYTRDEFLSLKVTDLHPRDEIPKFKDHFAHITHGIDQVGLWHHITKDGQVLNVDMTVESFVENNRLYRINIAKEVKNRVNIQRLHELSINQLKYHLKNSPLLYIEWDEHFRIKNFSEEILDKYSFSFDDLYNKTPADLAPMAVRKDDIDLIKYRMYQTLTTNHTRTEFEIEFYDAHHNVIYTQWHNSILRDADNNIVSILSMINDITENKKIELELKSQNELTEAVIRSLPGIFYMFDEEGNYVKWNKNFEKLLGLTTDDFPNENLLDHYEGIDKEIVRRKLEEIKRKGETEFTVHIAAADGTKPTYYLTGVLSNFKGKRYIVGNGFDITKQEKTELELKQALHTKEILLSEIHHRVKNNLAVISGLLELATFHSENEEARNTLQQSMLRIRSMALIHEKLYQSKELSRIPMKDYIFELVNIIVESMSLDIAIDLEFDVDDLLMNINQAIPTALILNELVTNSLKHAFHNKKQGLIGITFKTSGKEYILQEYDNGIGLQSSKSHHLTLGGTLIKTLAHQLHGDLKYQNGSGTKATLTFPVLDNHGSATHLYN